MLRALFVVDSIAVAEPAMAGAVVVCGSHGGVSAARYVLALPARPHAVFFNDAGIGKDQAGIVGLAMLEQVGVIAVAYSHESARIGDAADGLDSGRVSRVNDSAMRAGLRAGQRVVDVVERLRVLTSSVPSSAPTSSAR
ncbi:MAG: hypothetical protein EHM87_07875 [Burkholderiales bacterium]|nr:MAG: hypothetical protein EHM87_07875 [Burkholderiales bacterium]